MKKLLLLPVTIFIVLAVSAQTNQQLITESRKLRSEGRYVTALQTLSSTKVFSAEILHELVDLLLTPPSRANKSFNKFTLEDKDENGQKVSRDFEIQFFGMLRFAADTFPNNCEIRSDIVRTCQALLLFDGPYWKESDISDIKETIEYYVQPKCPTYLSNYLLGMCYSYLGDMNKALPYLQKAVSMNESYLPALIAYSDALLKTKKYQDALVYGQKAMQKAARSSRMDQSNAALALGKTYNAMDDDQNALRYLFTADTLSRKDFFVLQELLDIYVKTNNTSKAVATTNTFLGSQGRTKLPYYIDVYKIYARRGRADQLISYCLESMNTYSDRPEILACLNFTLGMLYKNTNPNLALAYYKKAKELGLKSGDYVVTHHHPDTVKIVKEAFDMID
jgi:tetratricopeptide (TPR) repeat protein